MQQLKVERVIKDFLVPFSNRNIGEFIEYFADDATASRTYGMLYTPPEEAVSRAVERFAEAAVSWP